MNDKSHRILVIDDNPAIHDDLRKILIGTTETSPNVQEEEEILFGSDAEPKLEGQFHLDFAFQGQEGLALVLKASAEGRPYAMAFVDVRMPPGWDGVETITRIWAQYPELQVVICTAYSDYSWRDIIRSLGRSDNLVILKKPFDNIEVLQLAHALTTKWELTAQAKCRLQDLDRLVGERTKELTSANEKLRQEVTERALAEERFAKAFNTSPIPMVIQGLRDERLLDANESFLRMTGFTRPDLLGKSFSELHIWADPGTHLQIFSTLYGEKSVRNVPCQLKTKTGAARETVVFAEVFDLGKEPHVLLLAEDVTNRVELEAQLRQAQKMEAVGQLAAGVAHDFNNILTIILGHISLLIDTKKVGAEAEKPLTQVLAAGERASMLTRQLLAFSRKQMMQRRPIRLHTLLDQHNQMLHRLIGEHIELDFVCPEDLPAVFADACNVEQVILNLAVNSRDAMPQGGRLTLSAQSVQIDQAYVERVPEAIVGQFVCLSVSDTGCGMDEETRAHIFEPFFTTKEVGQGTGMGLASVYGIVKQHGGWIEVESQLRRGTTFRIFFPVSTQSEEPANLDEKAHSEPARRGTETILLVEDEAFLREFVQTVLQSYGYKILTASDGNDALRLWNECGGKIDLLLTDIVMPGGMTGRELTEQLTALKPDLKAIYTSGYSVDVLGPDLKWDDEHTFLQKPYEAQVLIQTVRQCLDEATPDGSFVNNRWMAPAA